MQKLEVERIGCVSVIRIDGDLDVHNDEAFVEAVVHELKDGFVQIVVNLGGIKKLDSSGLGKFVSALKKAREKGGDVKLAEPTKHVGAVFGITGVNRIFEIFATEADALAKAQTDGRSTIT